MKVFDFNLRLPDGLLLSKFFDVFRKIESTILFRIAFIIILNLGFCLNILIANNLIQPQTANYNNQERVFLHLDKTYYLSGTDLNYSAYITSVNSQTLSNNSDVLYVRILDPNLEVVLTQQVVTKNGRGQGKILLNDTFKSGTYLIVAYTNLMLNSTENHFKQAIEVIDPNDPPTVFQKDQFKVKFYPEGGHLIGGHLNNIVCEMKGSTKSVSGSVITNHGDTVAIIDNFQHNYADFNLLPIDTLNYQVHFTVDGKLQTFELNDVETNAVTCRAIGLQSDTITLLVNAGKQYRGPDIGILVQNKGNTILAATQAISGSRIKFSIPKSSLGTGINHLIVYDYQQRYLASRSIFLETKPAGKLSIKLDKSSYIPKEQINIPIEFEDTRNDQNELSLSVSIKNLSYFDTETANRIDYHSSILSNLNTIYSEPEIVKNFGNEKVLDNFLKTQSMNHIDIPTLLNIQPKSSFNRSSDNQDYFIISGRVMDQATNKPIGDSIIYCSVVGDNPQFFSSVTERDGRFTFQVRSFSGNSDIILKLSNVDELKQNVSYILDPSSYDYDEIIINSLTNTVMSKGKIEAYALFRKQDVLVQRVYNPLDIKNRAEQIKKKTIGFFPKYDFERDLTEYELLNDFNEIARELITGLTIKGKLGDQTIYLREKENKKKEKPDAAMYQRTSVLMEDPPLFLIDGLPVFTSNRILNINPAKIKEIKLLNEKYFINGIIHDGVLELSTLEADYYQKYETNHYTYSKQGFYQAKKEYSVKGFSEQNDMDRFPDFKDVLYWNPTLNIRAQQSKNIEFVASDDHADFLIEVQGVDSEGNTYYDQAIFSIRD